MKGGEKMTFIQNPIVLGAIVVILVWLIRKFGWSMGGLGALWLTMLVALVLALVERLLQAGIPNFLVCEMVPEPVGFLSCLFAIIRAISEEAGVIFVAAQLIYQVLRREIVGRSILGQRI